MEFKHLTTNTLHRFNELLRMNNKKEAVLYGAIESLVNMVSMQVKQLRQETSTVLTNVLNDDGFSISYPRPMDSVFSNDCQLSALIKEHSILLLNNEDLQNEICYLFEHNFQKISHDSILRSLGDLNYLFNFFGLTIPEFLCASHMEGWSRYEPMFDSDKKLIKIFHEGYQDYFEIYGDSYPAVMIEPMERLFDNLVARIDKTIVYKNEAASNLVRDNITFEDLQALDAVLYKRADFGYGMVIELEDSEFFKYVRIENEGFANQCRFIFTSRHNDHNTTLLLTIPKQKESEINQKYITIGKTFAFIIFEDTGSVSHLVTLPQNTNQGPYYKVMDYICLKEVIRNSSKILQQLEAELRRAAEEALDQD